jgi:predicted nuclease of predicted toxin-antitoxin system
VKLLIDNALSPAVAAGLRAAGHDAVHVLDLGMQAATDEAIFEMGARESRAVISADTDFGSLLALREATSPSVILLRGGSPKRAAAQVALILASLASIKAPLGRGAIVVLEPHRLRVRELPVSRGPHV